MLSTDLKLRLQVLGGVRQLFQARLTAQNVGILGEVIAWADLIVAVTDDPFAQSILDQLLADHDKPGVFAGGYPGGHQGEIVLVIPGLTTCYRCYMGQRRAAAAAEPRMDYAIHRQVGSVALGADVTNVATVAARTALGLLGLQHGDDRTLSAPILEGRSVVHIGMTPEAFVGYPTFKKTRNQHMFQSVWMRAEPQPNCPECAALDWPAPTDQRGRVARLRARVHSVMICGLTGVFTSRFRRRRN